MLPPAFLVASQGEARLVVGPTGAFVLLDADGSTRPVPEAAQRLTQLTRLTRAALCDHLAWVPFLDALLITSSTDDLTADVSCAPLDLVQATMTEGPPVIPSDTLNVIREAVRANGLDGWAAGAPGSLRIDLCDPAPEVRGGVTGVV
jgi:hypothetical protein